ncbi:unnamed protein product [Lupinus luteus]|uniref:RING-CH-type domain-containing protein n=1 Tax=Lupinus luteus TaxID=3873 RepID=A0AAV1X5W9_LUPLU
MSNDEKQALGTSENKDDIPIQKDLKSSEITEELPSKQHETMQNFILEIPTKTFEEVDEDFLTIKMPPTPASSPTRLNSFSKNRSTITNFLPKLSYKICKASSEIENSVALQGSCTVEPKKPVILRTLSLTKLAASTGKTTSSLPVDPNPETINGRNIASVAVSVVSSFATIALFPEFTKDENVPVGGMFRIVPTTPRLVENNATTTPTSMPVDTVENEVRGEDIPEEEAVCRICITELGECADTLKLECNCKGELSLAHQECAVKWFSIKGNRICDVCKKEVQNLPVTLLRVRTVRERRGGHQAEISHYRFWQHALILVIVNMLAYFGFLEQFLVHIPAVLAILLGIFTGFGVVMCGATFLAEILKLSRRRGLAQSNQQRDYEHAILPDQSSTAEVHQAQTDSHHPESNLGYTPAHVS